MAPSKTKKWCSHCKKYIPKKLELEHRKLQFALYPPTPSTSKSRLFHIVNGTLDSETHEEQEVHDNGEAISGMVIDDRDSFAAAAVEDVGSSADAAQPVHGNDEPFGESMFEPPPTFTVWPSWANSSDESDGDGDETEEPYPMLEDPDSDNESDDDLVDWDTIDGNDGLSSWDRLAEHYERDVANIGACLLALTTEKHLFLTSYLLENRLATRDLAICRAFAYKVKSHTTDSDFKKLPFAFPSDPPLPKLDALRS